MSSFIRFFVTRHLIVNIITFLVLLGGVFAWQLSNKEELPDITFNRIRVYASYPGASAEDVEFYVTRPIEESLRGIDGVVEMVSSSGPGSSTVSLEIDQALVDFDQVYVDVQNQVNTVQLPPEVLDDPRVRMFETSKKAIIDLVLYNEDYTLLDVAARQQLQAVARSLENQLTSRPEIYELTSAGMLNEELEIQVDPEKSSFYEIPLSTVISEIRRNNLRAPAGTLKSGSNEQVTLLSELTTKSSLDRLVVQGGFDSNPVKLSAIAEVSDSFEDQTEIIKVNGREAILFNVVKNGNYGILESLDVVYDVTDRFKKTVLADTSIQLTFLDDESVDVRNRLGIIASNGLLGFLLILITLFVFLNKRAGFWVALGIPFTLAFTLIAGKLLGFSINGVTLAGIIIVLGIVVDDAIIVAENVSRKLNEGGDPETAAVDGAREVVAPIVASILTTCAAFIPLYFFTGWHGNLIKFLPPMIFLMLFASVLESFLLLPSHMILFLGKRKKTSSVGPRDWFARWESSYERWLIPLLRRRYAVLGVFGVLLVGAWMVASTQFSFVMFPNTESRELVISGYASGAGTPQATSEAIQPIEEYLRRYIGNEGVGIRTEIARGRGGYASVENRFRIILEVKPPGDRERSSSEILAEIQAKVGSMSGFEKLNFRSSRWGQSSGSLFEVLVQENNDAQRDQLVNDVVEILQKEPQLMSVEPDSIPSKISYELTYDQEQLKRLSVNPATIASTLRTVFNGTRLFTVFRNDEEIDVLLTVNDAYRESLSAATQVPVENSQSYLVPLADVVNVTEYRAKSTIRRINEKRSSYVYADLTPTASMSPLEFATYAENELFVPLLKRYPHARLSFQGEVIDTRESKRDLRYAMIGVVGLIYVVLVVLFNSLLKPLRVMLVVPFGVIGVILAFYVHQKTAFGFYAAIGALGMLGVVVNDAIVMLNKLDKRVASNAELVEETARIAKTRLRAIVLTTLTTVVGVMPTAYGIGGMDAMLSDMMLSLAWGLLFGSLVTLILIPCFFCFEQDFRRVAGKFFGTWQAKFGVSAVFLLVGLCLPNPIEAYPVQVITPSEFSRIAMEKDTAFHTMMLDELTFKYLDDLNVTPPEFALDISSDYFFGDEAGPFNQFTLSQTLPSFGQTFSVSRVDNRFTGVEVNTFRFSQDIARNAFGRTVRLDRAIQRHATAIARYQWVEAYEDYLADSMDLYYRWVRQYESWQIAKSSYRENQKVMVSIKNRQKEKIADQTDVNKFKLQIMTREQRMIRFERDFLTLTNEIRRALALPNDVAIIPDTTIELADVSESVEIALERFLKESRTAKMVEALDLQRTVEVARDVRDLFPSIQLTAAYVQEPNENQAQAGISFSFPFRNERAKAQVETAEITLDRTVLNNFTLIERLKVQLRNLYISLQKQQELVHIAVNQRKIAEAILDEEFENYTFGRVNLNDYIQAVNNFDNARFDEIQETLAFMQLALEWRRITDTLVIKGPNSNGSKVRPQEKEKLK